MIEVKRFNPGDLLTREVIDSHADAINQLVRGIKTQRQAKHLPTQTLVYIENYTGADLGYCAVLGLGDPRHNDPTGDGEAFKWGELTFLGETPAEGAHEGKFAVLQDPLAAGNTALSIIQGVVRVKVIFATGTEKWADITDGSTATLTAAATGSARILWREGSGAGTVWCVCLIGAGGAGGGGVAGVIPVKVTMDGGEGGSASTDCSYTYSVDDENGNKIAEDMTPQTPRLLYTQYTAGDGWGWGCYDKDDNFILLDAGEKEVAEVIT